VIGAHDETVSTPRLAYLPRAVILVASITASAIVVVMLAVGSNSTAISIEPSWPVVSVVATPPTTPGAAAEPAMYVSGCDHPLPDEFDEIGSVHTVVTPDNATDFEVRISYPPTRLCPTGTVTVRLTITNVSDAPTVFAAGRGLILSSGLAKWNIGSIPDMRLAAGATVTVRVTGAIPAGLAPGTYTLFAEGYSGDTTITVSTPHTDQPAPSVGTTADEQRATTDPAPPSGAQTSNVIPDGTYTRVATLVDGEALGLGPEFVEAIAGPDGELPMSIEIDGDRWTIWTTDDTGSVQGEGGTASYDGNGRWVTVIENSDRCPECVRAFDWTYDDGTLTLTLSPILARDYDDLERFVTQGTYHRQ
jgi:hypothetical protein